MNEVAGYSLIFVGVFLLPVLVIGFLLRLRKKDDGENMKFPGWMSWRKQ